VKRIAVILVCFLSIGCAVMGEEADLSPTEMARRVEEIEASAMVRRFVSLRLVHQGMTRQEIQSVLNDKVIVGYELTDPAGRQYKPLTVDNPYRSQTVMRADKEYVVDYYLAGIKEQDDRVTDDELVPLVFYQDKLIGTGWAFLKARIP